MGYYWLLLVLSGQQITKETSTKSFFRSWQGNSDSWANHVPPNNLAHPPLMLPFPASTVEKRQEWVRFISLVSKDPIKLTLFSLG